MNRKARRRLRLSQRAAREVTSERYRTLWAKVRSGRAVIVPRRGRMLDGAIRSLASRGIFVERPLTGGEDVQRQRAAS